MLSCRRAFMPPRKKIHRSEPQEFVVHRSLKSPTEVKKASRTTIKVSRTTMSAKIEPHKNDVLLGRGGKNNQHSGNEKLREISKLECEEYRVASKKGKSIISRGLVDQMKALSPAGRFLKRDNAGKWEDVGGDVAREKASQVLRDAVAIEMGPLASSSSYKRKEKVSPSMGSSRLFEEEAAGAEFRRQSAAPPSQRECRPDRQQSSASIWSRAETPRVASLSSGAPPYLPVTPISSSYEPSRKRPRYHHEPQPYFYGHHSSPMIRRVTSNTTPIQVSSPMIGMTRSTPPSQEVMSPMVAVSRNTPPSSQEAKSPMIGVTRMTPPQQVCQPPAPRSAGRQLSHPGFHFNHAGSYHQRYYPAPNSAPRSTISSARAGRSHFVPQSSEQQPLAEPGMPEPVVPNSDFDLFNGELLSDQSDREGTQSPSPFRFHYHRDYPDSI